jgi:glycosyltransferase involved in cell wall biosynthesis
VSKPRLIVVGPLPPPTHGVTVSTSLVLANRYLHERFVVEHLDTSDPRPARTIGVWDPTNVVLAFRAAMLLVRLSRGKQGTLYLPLSQGAAGFLRDSIFILYGAVRGWKVAGHLRGGEFDAFYRSCGRARRAWIRFTLRHVSSVAVVGSTLRSVFDGLLTVDKIAVVRNGTPDPNPDGCSRDRATVLFLSNLWRRKGVREALDAALHVIREHPDARFAFVGEWEDDELERDSRSRVRAYTDRIQFHAAAIGDEKRRLLLSASLLLFPPQAPEGHPRVVLEAMSAGLPVVTTARGAIAETVVNGESGIVLDDPEPEALARAILRLLRDDDVRERMGRAARARYLALFTQEQADRRLADWLEEVAFRDPGRRFRVRRAEDATCSRRRVS